jgi:hypothetical protein
MSKARILADLISDSQITASEITGLELNAIQQGDTIVEVSDTGSGGKVVVRVDGADNSEFNAGGIKVPSGTTAQRDPAAVVGSLRYNTTIGFFETLTGSGWGAVATPPSITGITPSNFDGAAGATFTVDGAFFDTATTAVFKGADGTDYAAATVTYVSTTQITITNATNLPVANEPFRISVTNGAGLSAESIQGIDAGSVPAFTTAAGTLATTTRWDDAVSVTVNATDAENTISGYAVTEGNLPAGLTLDGTTGAITGTSTEQTTTTYTFTIEATDSAGNTNTRQFNIQIVNSAPVWSSPADGVTLDVNGAASISLSASDPEGSNVSYSSSNLPTGFSISGNTITGTSNSYVTSSVLVNASDGYNFSGRSFFINNIAPRLGLSSWPSTIIGFADPSVSSYDVSGSNFVGYTSPYDGRFVNEWDVLSDQNIVGANGISPSNITSPLGRTVPSSTWASLRNIGDRQGNAQSAERAGFGLFSVGRDCPSSVTTINVLAYGGGGYQTMANYAQTQFSVVDQDTFRICIGAGASNGGSKPAANGVGGGGADGDGSGRGGGGGTGFWDVGISRSSSSSNRFVVAGGGGNYVNNNGRVGTSAANSTQGDTLYSAIAYTNGQDPGNNAANYHMGGGPGAGGYSSTGGNSFSLSNTGNPGAYNTGTGQADRSQETMSDIYRRGDGGGTGGSGSNPTDRTTGGGGGFAYNAIGLGGGGGQFGGGGGWQGGGGGWGDSGTAGSSFANGGTTPTYGIGPVGPSGSNTFSTYNPPVSGLSHPYDYHSHGIVLVWW